MVVMQEARRRIRRPSIENTLINALKQKIEELEKERSAAARNATKELEALRYRVKTLEATFDQQRKNYPSNASETYHLDVHKDDMGLNCFDTEKCIVIRHTNYGR